MIFTRIVSTAGWTGAVTSLTAYALNSNGFIASKSLAYLVMNAVATSLLIFYTFNKRAFVNTTLNSVWLLVTIIAVCKLLFY